MDINVAMAAPSIFKLNPKIKIGSNITFKTAPIAMPKLACLAKPSERIRLANMGFNITGTEPTAMVQNK